MEPEVLRPEKEQRTMWFIGWAVPFVLGFALLVVLLLAGVLPAGELLAIGPLVVGWLILMSPIPLYIRAYYIALEYVIDNDSVKMKKGVFWRKRVTVPYTKITNVDITQGPVQRMFNIGTIQSQTAGAGGPGSGQAELNLVGVRDLEGLKDLIMERVRGHTISRPKEEQNEGIDESGSEILRQMLKELTAIREVLEERQS